MDRLTAATVFVAIVERGSLTGAADRLGLSRAMVTRHLQTMEDWCGARLLHRTTRRLSLTPVGEETLARARELLRIADGMAQPVGDPGDDGLRGRLRVACAQSLAQDVLIAGLAPFLARHPQLQVDLLAGSAPVNLVEERIDLALRITNQLDAGVIARRLGRVDSVLCASPAYLAARGTPQSVAELAQHNCLTYAYFGQGVWQFTLPDGRNEMVPVQGSLSSDESLILREAALAGMGIVMLPRYSARAGLQAGALVSVLDQAHVLDLQLYGLYSSRRHLSPALRGLLDHLTALFGDEK